MTVDSAVSEQEGNVLVVRDTLVPNPKQREFFRTCALDYDLCEEVLFDGSIRAGKTQAAVKLIVAWAMKTGGTYVISRFSYRELEDSTKKVCLYGEGGLPPAIPAQLLRGGSLDKAKNETHNKVTLANGAEILFRALEEKERGKIRNLTACGWFIDQAEELDGEDVADFYQEIKGRCSDPRGPRKLILVANPGPTDHFLHGRFIDPVTRYDRARRVHVTILDNRDNLPADYVAMLLRTEHTNIDYFKRMVMGEWGAHGGKRFKSWNRNQHVLDRCFDVPDGWEILEGLDDGWHNPFAWLSIAVDYTGRWWVTSEYRATETTVPVRAERIKALRAADHGEDPDRPFRGQLQPSASWLDPSAWAKRGEHDSIAHQFLENEIFVAKANNERLGGWSRIDSMLSAIMDDGYPRLRIFPTCEGLIRELPNARIKAPTDDIEKVNDHSLDALRYVVMSRMPTPEEQTVEETNTKEAVVRRMLDRYADRDREGAGVYEGG